jgi:hypothetical protein
MKIFITRAEASNAEKLGERNGVETVARMEGRLKDVRMDISGFIKKN